MTNQLSLFSHQWLDEAEAVVLSKFSPGSSFSSDDVHRVVSEPEHDNLVGILFARLRRKGLIVRTGSRVSERLSANGRWIGVYQTR